MARNTRAAAHKGGPSLAARLPGGRCILPAAVRAVVSCALTAARADCLLRDRRSWAARSLFRRGNQFSIGIDVPSTRVEKSQDSARIRTWEFDHSNSRLS